MTVLLAATLRDFLPLVYLLAATCVGVLAILLVNRWRKGGANLTPSASDQLAQYRALYEKGAISEEEYRRLRSLLGGEIRRNLDVPGKPSSPAGAAPVPPPTPPASEPPPDTGIRPT